MRELTVKIDRDPDAKVWVTWNSEVPGLTAVDDKSQKGLIAQIREVAPELLALSRSSTRFRSEPDGQYTVKVVRQAYRTNGPVRQVASFTVTAKPA